MIERMWHVLQIVERQVENSEELFVRAISKEGGDISVLKICQGVQSITDVLDAIIVKI